MFSSCKSFLLGIGASIAIMLATIFAPSKSKRYALGHEPSLLNPFLSIRTMFASFLVLCLMLFSLAACKNGTLTINTSDLDKNAQALSYLVKEVVSNPVISSHLTADQLNALYDAETKITNVTAQIAQNSSGAVSIDTSSTWAKSLISEVRTFISIASPIVSQYDPQAGSYLTLANQLLPFVQAIVDLATSNTATPAATTTTVGASIALAPIQAAQIRAAIYHGM